jgi:hypothetical protein
MWGLMYVNEKLREFEAEQRLRAHRRPASPARKPALGPMARSAGSALQRLGTALESWGSSHHVAEPNSSAEEASNA